MPQAPIFNLHFDEQYFGIRTLKVTYVNFLEEPEEFTNIEEIQFDPVEDILIIKTIYDNVDSFPIESISKLEIILEMASLG